MRWYNTYLCFMPKNKTILVAPLHWGLGHASRCIPIINALLTHDFNVIVASDGGALLLLQKEFPQLESIQLPSYNITYPKKGGHFKWKFLLKLPAIQQTITSEKKVIATLVSEGKIDGIISDNRFGVRNKKVPSVFVTHQLNVLSGKTTRVSSKLHQKVIKKFDACWVPDVEAPVNLSGKLGHLEKDLLNTKYIGPLSRMVKHERAIKYDILALLSGPEPQRSLLEEKLLTELKGSDKEVLLVQGMMEKTQKRSVSENITIVNFMLSTELEHAINESDLVVSRSGYTTIMDLASLEKKAFFIPTPGQYEQEYLAKKLKRKGIVPSCKQRNFSVKKLEKVIAYKGLSGFKVEQDFKELFSLF